MDELTRYHPGVRDRRKLRGQPDVCEPTNIIVVTHVRSSGSQQIRVGAPSNRCPSGTPRALACDAALLQPCSPILSDSVVMLRDEILLERSLLKCFTSQWTELTTTERGRFLSKVESLMPSVEGGWGGIERHKAINTHAKAAHSSAEFLGINQKCFRWSLIFVFGAVKGIIIYLQSDFFQPFWLVSHQLLRLDWGRHDYFITACNGAHCIRSLVWSRNQQQSR